MRSLGDREFDSLLQLASASQARQRHQKAQKEEICRRPSIQFGPLTGTLVFSRSEIAKLSAFVRNLVPEPGMLDPGFFLASVLPNRWRPCVVVVSQEQQVEGLVYCKERVIAGIGTSIALGYDDLNIMVVASPEKTESVMRCGVETLLKSMAGLRFLVAANRLPLLKDFQGAAEVKFCCAKRHSHLELPRTYDEFLGKVGPLTRRNLRYFRRKSKQAGNEFISDLAFSDFCAAARCLFPKAAYAKSKQELERCLAMVEAMPSGMLVGLRRRGSEWISLAGGWHIGDCAIMNMQLNDRTCTRESLSLVLRSYLIEELINRGCRELVFWAGTSAPLSFSCTSPELFIAYVDSSSLPWRFFRSACATLSRFSPRSFSKQLKWVAPGHSSAPILCKERIS